MSAIKSKYECKEILDFSVGKITKSSILKSLRQADFVQKYYNKNGVGLTYVENEIVVGMYKIHLLLRFNNEAKKLRQYGKFQVIICDNQIIDLSKDFRFKSQSWVKLNKKNKLTISNLVDIILYCKKLDKLKIFL